MAKAPRSLEQLLTFSRGSAAGYFGQAGKFVWQKASRNKAPLIAGGWSYTEGLLPAPDGSFNTIKDTQGATDGSSAPHYVFSYPGQHERCLSAYVHAPAMRYLYIYSNGNLGGDYSFFDTQTLTTTQQGYAPRAGIEDVGGGWYRIYRSFDAKEASTGLAWIIGASEVLNAVDTPSRGHDVHVWGMQAEDADFPTPYVAPSYSPRIDWRAGKRKGLLVEGASTNLLTQSEFATGLPANGTGGPLTATTFADLVQGTGLAFGTGSTAYCYPEFAYTAGVQYTFSVFVRMDDGGAPQFDASGSSAATDFVLWINSARDTSGYQVEHIHGSLYRVSCQYTPGATASYPTGLVKYSSNSSRTFKTAGWQLEAKPYATSYIPTTTAQVTRATDVAKIEGEAFKSWFNAAKGTLYVEYSFHGGSAIRSNQRHFAELSNSSGSNVIILYNPNSSAGGVYMTKDSTEQAYIAGGAAAAHGADNRTAFAWGDGTAELATNGGTPVIDNAALAPVGIVMLGFGRSPIAEQGLFDGYIKDFRFFPERLSAEALQALTAA